ncbi:MAG: protein kinase [Actinobacteria bacterium]|nr:protein kinase [Actinomycetota bacterium]
MGVSSSLPKVPGYELDRFLGTGAGSKIYSVRNNRTQQLLVLKHVLRSKPEDERFITQVLNEYRLGNRVNHPALRRVVEIRKKGLFSIREVFLFMEPVKGKHLEESQPTDLAVILQIMLAVSEGLAAIHQLGFVHADVNPRNILFSRASQTKLIDYGLSCPIGTVKRRVQGTLVFLAPEQARMERIDHRTDIFNFAAVLYWLVTSHTIGPPKVGQDLGQRTAIPDPRQLNPNASESLSQLLLQCLSENRPDRPESMLSVSQALRAELAQTIKLPADRRAVRSGRLPSQSVPRHIPLLNNHQD